MLTESDHPPVVIQPLRGWDPLELAEIWRHRYVLIAIMRRDLVTRYRQTLLGPLWFVIAPLGRMGVFSIVFGKIAALPSEGVPYPLFTYTALVPWELFASGVQRCTNSMIKYQGIIPKVYFPRLIIPLSEALSALIDFGCSLIILFVLMLLYGMPFSPRILLLPLFVLPAFAAGLTVGLLFASMQVRYRDAVQFVGYLLQTWSFATPVAYSATLAAKNFSTEVWYIYKLNPMFAVVEGFRWMFLGIGQPPDAMMLGVFIGTLVCLLAAAAIFQRTQHLVVDLLSS